MLQTVALPKVQHDSIRKQGPALHYTCVEGKQQWKQQKLAKLLRSLGQQMG
jgi:hypothetical protein